MSEFSKIGITHQRHCNILTYKPFKRALAIIAILVAAMSATRAQSLYSVEGERVNVRIDSVTIEILFPLGKSVVDPAYRDNKANLQRFMDHLNAIKNDSSQHLEKIHITGYASPEGNYSLNKRLSMERANAMGAYVRKNASLPDSLLVITAGGVDWASLANMVQASSLTNKADVLHIILHEPEITTVGNRSVENRKNKLMALNGGATWRWLMDNFYPSLRSASSKIVCYIETIVPAPKPVATEPIDTVAVAPTPIEVTELPAPEPEPVDTIIEVVEEIVPPIAVPEYTYSKYPVMALRTILLLPLLNVGAEVPIGNRWSVGADYYYPWVWPKSNNKNCFELIFVSAEARYWFGKRHTSDYANRQYRLTGHSVGVYGAWGYYDIEHNYKGHQGHGWSAGVDYLYAMPIAKGRLHLEFEIALGAVWSTAQPYKVYQDGGNLVPDKTRRKHFSYVGPTKVGVSLVLPINRSVKSKATVIR